MKHKKKKYYGTGGSLKPKAKKANYQTGGNINMFGQLGQMAGGALSGGTAASNSGTQFAGGALQGAATGLQFGPIGALAGGILGGVGGLMKASKAQQVEFQQDAAKRMAEKKRTMAAADQYYSTFPEHGIRNAGFFARNGAIVPGANTNHEVNYAKTKKIKGKNHEDGGTPMIVNGVAIEAEKGETMRRDPNGDVTIFSKRIGPYDDSVSYATMADNLNANGDQEGLKRLAEMQGNDPRANQSNMMQTGGTINPITPRKALTMPSVNAPTTAIPLANSTSAPITMNSSRGSGLGQQFQNLTPFIDNVVNAALLNRTPNIPNPRLDKNVRLNTNVDVSDQLAAVRDQNAQFNQFVNQNLRGGGKRAALGNAFATRLEQENQIRGAANRQEMDLKNRQALVNADVDARNNQVLRQYDRDVTDRADYINSQLSANARNLTSDLMGIGRDKAASNLEMAQLRIVSKMFNKGLLERNDLTPEMVMFLKSKPNATQAQIKAFKDSKK